MLLFGFTASTGTVHHTRNKAQWKKCMAAGHMTCCSVPFIRFLWSRIPVKGWCYPQRTDLPISNSVIEIIPHWRSQKSISQVTLDTVKLTVNTSQTVTCPPFSKKKHYWRTLRDWSFSSEGEAGVDSSERILSPQHTTFPNKLVFAFPIRHC